MIYMEVPVLKGLKRQLNVKCWKKTTNCIIFSNNCWHPYKIWLLLCHCYSL